MCQSVYYMLDMGNISMGSVVGSVSSMGSVVGSVGSEKALGAQSLSSSFQKTLCTPYVHCVGQWTRALKFVRARQTFKHSRCTSKLYVRICANICEQTVVMCA